MAVVVAVRFAALYHYTVLLLRRGLHARSSPPICACGGPNNQRGDGRVDLVFSKKPVHVRNDSSKSSKPCALARSLTHKRIKIDIERIKRLGPAHSVSFNCSFLCTTFGLSAMKYSMQVDAPVHGHRRYDGRERSRVENEEDIHRLAKRRQYECSPKLKQQYEKPHNTQVTKRALVDNLEDNMYRDKNRSLFGQTETRQSCRCRSGSRFIIVHTWIS